MFKKMSLMPIALAAGLFAGGNATAGIVQTPEQKYGFSLNFGDPVKIISIAGFDSGLGRLQSVYLTLHVESAILETYVMLRPGTTVGSVSNEFSTGTLIVEGPAGLTVSSSLSNAPYTGNVVNNQVITSAIAVPADVSAAIHGTPATLSDYLGTMLVSLNLSNRTVQQGTCVAPVACGTDGSASGWLAIRYEYSNGRNNSVPEPASLGLFGIGAASTAIRRRKRTVENA